MNEMLNTTFPYSMNILLHEVLKAELCQKWYELKWKNMVTLNIFQIMRKNIFLTFQLSRLRWSIITELTIMYKLNSHAKSILIYPASYNLSSSIGILMMIYSICSIIAGIAGEFIAIVAVQISCHFHHLQNQFGFVTTVMKNLWKTHDESCE